jgi:uncharacterized SAM-binding protein YcdF (DUF218 family)
VTSVVSYFFSSGGIALVLVAAAVWLGLRRESTNARRLLMAGAVLYAVFSSYPISRATGWLLTNGFTPLSRGDVPAGRTAIVVLGSGTFTARDWNQNRLPVLDRVSASRVLEAFRVFRMTDAEWVVSSAGLVRPSDLEEPNGQTMKDALIRMGVPPSRVLLETASRNTHDEAVIVRGLLEPLPVEHVVLVTSDVHMRRSLGTFRAQGIAAIPAIAHHPAPTMPWLLWVLPSRAGLDHAADVWHEILGIGYYAVRGWYTWR